MRIWCGSCVFFFSSRRRHTRWTGDWSSDVCSSDLELDGASDERYIAGRGGASRMKILFIGDIFGQPGRRIVKEALPALLEEFSPDLVLANGENAAAGFGITPPLVEELLDAG